MKIKVKLGLFVGAVVLFSGVVTAFSYRNDLASYDKAYVIGKEVINMVAMRDDVVCEQDGLVYDNPDEEVWDFYKYPKHEFQNQRFFTTADSETITVHLPRRVQKNVPTSMLPVVVGERAYVIGDGTGMEFDDTVKLYLCTSGESLPDSHGIYAAYDIYEIRDKDTSVLLGYYLKGLEE